MARRRRIGTPAVKLALVGVVGLICAGLVGGSTVSRDGTVNFDAALNRAVGEVSGTGGTLKAGSTRLCDSFDPAQSFDSWCHVVQRTYSRTLLAFAGKPGDDSKLIVPDLAEALPTVSADFTVWTFVLRDGLRWDDGSPITSGDVRMAIQRLYNPDIIGSVSTEALCLLSACTTGAPDYKGAVSGRSLKSIRLPDDRTIVFTLTRPYAMFANIVALPQYAPIESSREEELAASGSTYGSAPASSGPFVIKVNRKAGTVTLTRNPEWSQTLDGVRTPQVDAIEWTVYPSDKELDQALLKGEVDVRLDGGLGQTARDVAAADSQLRNRIDEPTTGSVSYIALVPTAPPLDNTACREALLFAIDKTDLIKVRGGPDVLRAVGNMMSPVLPSGVVSDDPYPAGPTGSVEAARRKLIECGYPDGFDVNMAYVNLGVGKALFGSVQRSLARVGIIVNPVQFDSFLAYFTTGVGSQSSLRDRGIGLVATNWYPEGTSALSYFGPIADGRKITARSNVNYSGVNDDVINALLDELEAGNPDVAGVARSVGARMMETALYLPYGMDKLVLYRGPQLTNVYVQQALGGQYDVVNMGLRR